MKKRVLSLFIVIAMFLGYLPTNIVAANGDKGIMSGTSGIQSPYIEKYHEVINHIPHDGINHIPNDYIYFGTNENEQIKWRVLDASNTNFGTSGMFLLSDELIGSNGRNGIPFDKNGYKNTEQAQITDWQGSDAQSWSRSFSTSGFAVKEAEAILPATKFDNKVEDLFPDFWGYGADIEESSLNNEKIFFLSAEEASNYLANYEGSPQLIAGMKGSPYHWWLRSPLREKYLTKDVASVDRSGNIARFPLTKPLLARPAMNLDLNSIIFTSAAVGGKSVLGMESKPTAVSDYDGNEWKVTLKDNSRSNFVINATGPSTFTYENAITGTNEYISVVIKDEASGAITHYGRLKNVATPSDASGTITMELSGIDMTGKKLYIFNEQYNGDMVSDYASDLHEFVGKKATYKVSFNANGGKGTMSEVRDISTEYTLPNNEFIAPKGKQFKTWAENSKDGTQYNAGASYNGNSDTVFYAVWEDAPEYSMNVNTTKIDFGTMYVDDYIPVAKTVTITNTGNRPITLNQPTATNYEIGDLSKTTLEAGGKATFTIQPKKNQKVKTYAETIDISGSNDTSAQIKATYTLKEKRIVAFAGFEWWVIGNGVSGVRSPNENSITMFSKNDNFGYTPFRKMSNGSIDGYSPYSPKGSSLRDYFANNPSKMNPWITPNEYAGSTLQQKINGITADFPEKEQQLIIPRLLTSDDGIAGQDVLNQKLWAISRNERNMINSITAWKYDHHYWWTRSAEFSDEDYGEEVWLDDGIARGSEVIPSLDFSFISADLYGEEERSVEARPALYLDMSSFFFASAANEKGKESAEVGEGMVKINIPANVEKFTMFDSTLSLSVGATKKQQTQSGKVLDFSYSNATTGLDQYISYILKNESGLIEYYGKLVDSSKNKDGKLNISLKNVPDGSYILDVFSEQANENMYTDYASHPITMKVAVKDGVGTVSEFMGDEIIEYAATPIIHDKLKDANYIKDDKAKVLHVNASVSDSGTLSYQWYKNTANSTSNGVEIEGATSKDYTPSTSETGTIYYYCVVTNTNNNATLNKTATAVSSVAKIVVSLVAPIQPATVEPEPAKAETPSQTPAKKEAVNTGDHNTMLSWVSALIVSAGVVCLIYIKATHKKQR